ncbi:MAG: LptE family protein [Chlorobiaceae bacterium]|nr:LptE family protein [Chlorobiaceae bacterium]
MRKTTGTHGLLVCLLCVLLHGCYSFSGASLPPHLQTVAVPLFDDSSQAGIAGFRETVTRSLSGKLEAESSLSLEPDPARADAVLKGVIVSYTDEPSQLGGSTERAVTNRITMVIKAVFEDRVKKTGLFTQSFVGFADYTSGNYDAQQSAIQSAIDMAVEDLFNRMISNW